MFEPHLKNRHQILQDIKSSAKEFHNAKSVSDTDNVLGTKDQISTHHRNQKQVFIPVISVYSHEMGRMVSYELASRNCC